MNAPALPDDRDHALPCRPTISCTADIVAPGAFEVEAGTLHAHADGLTQWTFPVLLKQSFTRWLQLQVGSNGLTIIRDGSHAQFLDNIFVGPKLHVLDQGTYAPSLALTAQVSLPTFSADGYARHENAFFIAHASKDVGPIHVDLNGGLSAWHLDDSPKTQGYVALAASAALPAHFGAVVEGYFFSDALPAAPRDGGVRAALTFAARPWLVIDAGADGGFFPSARAYSLFGGVTIVPVVFWRSALPPVHPIGP
jgi:Putative MetA-pathway of phenol degradation